MNRIAILGASSQIAKDLILSFAHQGNSDLLLYVRDVAATQNWLTCQGVIHPVMPYAAYGREAHDAVLNFVGVGDPKRALSWNRCICWIGRLMIDNGKE